MCFIHVFFFRQLAGAQESLVFERTDDERALWVWWLNMIEITYVLNNFRGWHAQLPSGA